MENSRERDKISLLASVFFDSFLFEKMAPFSSVALAVFPATGCFPLALLAYEAAESSLSPSGIYHGKSFQLVNFGVKDC